jgi:hypothetical protein
MGGSPRGCAALRWSMTQHLAGHRGDVPTNLWLRA